MVTASVESEFNAVESQVFKGGCSEEVVGFNLGFLRKGACLHHIYRTTSVPQKRNDSMRQQPSIPWP